MSRGADAKITSKSIDLGKEGQLDRAARRCSEKFSTPPWPRARSRPPARFRRRSRRANCCCRGSASRGASSRPSQLDRNFNLKITRRSAPRRHDRAASRRPSGLRGSRAHTDGGADVNQVTAGDGTTPLLMASINGQFDAAMLLIEKAPIRTCVEQFGAPLWATISAVAAPPLPGRSRWNCRRPAISRSWKRCSRPAPIRTAASSRTPGMVYTGCGNRNCGLADNSGSTPFWRAAYSVDLDAMKLLAEMRCRRQYSDDGATAGGAAVVAALRVIEAVRVAASRQPVSPVRRHRPRCPRRRCRSRRP